MNHPTQPSERQINDAYALARERYALLGVDSDQALQRLAGIPISLHCWQGDDVGGFESAAGSWAAVWRSPATTPARPATPTSCARTWTRRTA